MQNNTDKMKNQGIIGEIGESQAFLLRRYNSYAIKKIHPDYRRHIIMFNVFSIILFLLMQVFVNRGIFLEFDSGINAKVMTIWSPGLDEVMILITNILSPVGLFVISAILFFMSWKQMREHAMTLMSSILGGLLAVEIIKRIVMRARPENGLIEVAGYSFPSGHTAIAVIFFTYIIYRYMGCVDNRIHRVIFIMTNIMLASLVGFSRIYLNVHWASDVIAGGLIGFFIITLTIFVSEYGISHVKKK